MKVLHINCHYKFGSTGKIIENINKLLIKNKHSVFVAYALGNKTKDINTYKLSSRLEVAIYKRISYIFGMQYAIPIVPSLRLIRIIKKHKPDIVHFHSANAFTINIFKVLKYLSKNNYKVVITNHAEFYYTGNCSHSYDCDKWKTGCGKCPMLKNATGSRVLDLTSVSWKMMKKSFDSFNKKNIRIVSVSHWVDSKIKDSPIMNELPQNVIKNGIDTDTIFCRKEFNDLKVKHSIIDEKIILHVTSSFTTDENNIKGGKYIVELANALKPMKCKILIIANYFEYDQLPDNIILVGKIKDQLELARYYSMADLTVITSKRETFSMPVAESLACGTPVVGFKAGGPETIALKLYSEFVDYGRTNDLYNTVLKWINKKDKVTYEVEKVAKEIYSHKKMSREYLSLYENLIK